MVSENEIDDYVLIQDDDSLTTNSGSITISAWVFKKSAKFGLVAMKHTTSPIDGGEYGLATDAGNRLRFYGPSGRLLADYPDATLRLDPNASVPSDFRQRSGSSSTSPPRRHAGSVNS